MNLISAKLAIRETEDGFLSVRPEIPIGKEYVVDVDSLMVANGYDVQKNLFYQKALVFVMSATLDHSGWIAVDLLEFGNEQKEEIHETRTAS